MRVEVWSDFVCPFCYIGKRRFEAALQRFAHKDEVEVVFRSFELDPNSPRDVGHDVHAMLAAKYGMSRQQAIAMNANVAAQAEEAGLTFRFDTAILTNTFDAHRLAHFAASRGLMQPVVERLFQAYFTDSVHIGDRDTLAELAAEAGLDRAETARMLAGGDYADAVRADEDEAARLGARGVPFFVLNRKYAVSGAQSSDMFLNALQQAWQESQPLTVLNEAPDGSASAGVCDGDACAPSRDSTN
ncbi:hypothetical protein SD70_17410 [Gordoniibacillus kamchatkensis]|uniref:DSBA-like thioredoxin domain-containing protein n=1 Tax=Gordoniibacillus kamchatkensis TaxID=1590651 RepID=A0ABR5AFL1_9BACL|nr:DsbA family oxidoreductase [Paenibacillus sp. VKM B-2647]KIL39841.1 hypothetical protein SD70_17410 [Paenibacillus sp. VKM B-2647]